MKYRVEIAPKALEFIQTLPMKHKRQVFNRIQSLADNPRPPSSKKLKGNPKLYRVPSGVYRIVYKIEDNILHILVIRVDHRKNIYRLVSRLPK